MNVTLSLSLLDYTIYNDALAYRLQKARISPDHVHAVQTIAATLCGGMLGEPYFHILEGLHDALKEALEDAGATILDLTMPRALFSATPHMSLIERLHNRLSDEGYIVRYKSE